MEKTADEMLAILNRLYGIKSREEFWEIYNQSPKLDIGMFTKPIRRKDESKDNGGGNSDGNDGPVFAT